MLTEIVKRFIRVIHIIEKNQSWNKFSQQMFRYAVILIP